MAPKNRNKDFSRERQFGFGALVLTLLIIALIGGGLYWFFITFGDSLALPRPSASV